MTGWTNAGKDWDENCAAYKQFLNAAALNPQPYSMLKRHDIG
jgi:hypothetical protein